MNQNYMNQNDLRKAIYDSSDMADEEFFLSPSMQNFFNTLAAGVTEKLESAIQIQLEWQAHGNVASADSRNNLHLNCGSDFLCDFDRKKRFVFLKGLCLHECGHLLWTDFNLTEKRIQNIQSGKVYPETGTTAQNKVESTLHQFPSIASSLISLLLYVDNCIEDGFIEYQLLQLCGGYSRNLRILRDYQSQNVSTWEEMQSEGFDEMTILTNSVLIYAKYKKNLLTNYTGEPLQDVFISIVNDIDNAVQAVDNVERAKYVNTVFCKIAAYIIQSTEQKKDSPASDQSGASVQNDKKAASQEDDLGKGTQDNPDAGSSKEHGLGNNRNTSQGVSSSRTNGSNIQEAIQKAMENLDADMKDEGERSITTDVPIGNSSLLTNSKNDPKTAPASQRSKEDPMAEKEIDLLQRQELRRKIDEAQEQALCQELNDRLRNMPSTRHGYIQSTIERAKVGDQSEYDALKRRLDPIARRMQQELVRQIEDKRLGDNVKHLFNGPVIDLSSYIQRDGKVFSKKILPEDFPDMCVSVLIDMSGSMASSDKILIARDAAYVVHRFCTNLGIPVAVYGHNYMASVCLTSFSEFRSCDGKDGRRIASISRSHANGGNRDGYALRFCASHLCDQDSDVKILFVISDGMPSCYAPGEALIDMHDTVREFSKKGVIIIAAGIADDNKQIKIYYTDGIQPRYAAKFLDISDFHIMPKRFVKIIKQHIEKEF